MSKLKQDIEDSLIELVDEGYKIDVKNTITNGRSITNRDILSIEIKSPLYSGAEIDKLEDYLHQCYDLLEIDNYKVFNVVVNYSKTIDVKKLNRDKGDVEPRKYGELEINDWEELWDSIDFCLFSTPYGNMFNSIKLEFKK